MIVTVTLTMLYYDYTYLAIAPVQKVDNLYALDDSAIGFTNTYYWSATSVWTNGSWGRFSKVPETKRAWNQV